VGGGRFGRLDEQRLGLELGNRGRRRESGPCGDVLNGEVVILKRGRNGFDDRLGSGR